MKRFAPGPTPAGNFVPLVARASELGLAPLQECPLGVGVDFGQLSVAEPPVKGRARLDRQAVTGQVLRFEVDRLSEGVLPGLHRLEGHGVDQVETQVVEAGVASLPDGSPGLCPVGPPLEDGEGPGVEPLHPDA